MGTIIEFPANAASRRSGSTMVPPPDHHAKVLILPVVRIERHAETRDDGGPGQGDAPRRPRRRRVRS
ncbi:hypothetical protein [Rhodopseudomonas pseudopalustris]|uniref:Uncharacterized protein n=1 Tax=Rhodopseudomonas pseudopalustris TaxID=1513892 RepID=A0A1H8S2K1_9BRAD|nr:hypothetical protein [Rhodopseudomonas pseudopalustris]MBB1091759.1 hypothetical protein [Rhodopseudomonas palustris]SEO72767.1 hypothetical protein SAMN05444123_104226 [Rhodopseudomonas pseudopalustris]